MSAYKPMTPDQIREGFAEMRQMVAPLIESSEDHLRDLLDRGWSEATAEQAMILYLGACYAAMLRE